MLDGRSSGWRLAAFSDMRDCFPFSKGLGGTATFPTATGGERVVRPSNGQADGHGGETHRTEGTAGETDGIAGSHSTGGCGLGSLQIQYVLHEMSFLLVRL